MSSISSNKYKTVKFDNIKFLNPNVGTTANKLKFDITVDAYNKTINSMRNALSKYERILIDESKLAEGSR